jgi:trehalose 6-phosphate phosphatase
MKERAQTRMQKPIEAPPALDVHAHALFLDLDGTLIEIADHPDAVSASGELLELLHLLEEKMGGALALITGRTIADADRILSGAMQTIAGGHGFEIRVRSSPVHRENVSLKGVTAALTEARALATAKTLPAMIEEKLSSVALHYRHAPEMEPQVFEIAATLSKRHGLRMLHGKMVIELAAGARTKADALASLMDFPPFAGRTPIAIGDDITDENAFREAGRRGGFAILVGERRPSLARYRLSDPAGVFTWLGDAAAMETAR